MTPTEIEEGNRLIAEFMGFPPRQSTIGEIWPEPKNSFFVHDNPQYHSSWDWLMPVVEKIGNLKTRRPDGKELSMFSKISTDIGWDGYYNRGRMSIIGTMTFCRTESIPREYTTVDVPHIVQYGENKEPIIEVVWRVVVQFIQWYNTQTPNNNSNGI